MKPKKNIAYRYDIEGHSVVVDRNHLGTAYARNGNVHNPTEYYTWDSSVDGKTAGSGCATRADAYEYARAAVQGVRFNPGDQRGRGCINVRSFIVVREEMQANYRGRLYLT